MNNTERAALNRRTAAKLGGVFVLMFGFSFALVPLYDVLCDITGLGGRTGVVQASDLDGVVDEHRELKVEFMANTNSQLPWEFRADELAMQVRPGQIYETRYFARNTADETVTGQAVPNVSPPEASRYFNKTECFCFDNQTLAPGEVREMPVRFVVDRAMPAKFSTVTLSYTFFRIDQSNG